MMFAPNWVPVKVMLRNTTFRMYASGSSAVPQMMSPAPLPQAQKKKVYALDEDVARVFPDRHTVVAGVNVAVRDVDVVAADVERVGVERARVGRGVDPRVASAVGVGVDVEVRRHCEARCCR